MRIALLNMPFDGNYGGNLQRYALVKVLQNMGHEVEYLYMRDWTGKYSSGGFIKRLIHQKFGHKSYRKMCSKAEPFLEEYIPHTKIIHNHNLS